MTTKIRIYVLLDLLFYYSYFSIKTSESKKPLPPDRKISERRTLTSYFLLLGETASLFVIFRNVLNASFSTVPAYAQSDTNTKTHTDTHRHTQTHTHLHINAWRDIPEMQEPRYPLKKYPNLPQKCHAGITGVFHTIDPFKVSVAILQLAWVQSRLKLQ